MVQRTGLGPNPSRDSGHVGLAGNRERSSEESRFGVVCAMRALARQSPRDSRNLAVALALLALAAVMFFVTMVKFEEQMHIATQPPGDRERI